MDAEPPSKRRRTSTSRSISPVKDRPSRTPSPSAGASNSHDRKPRRSPEGTSQTRQHNGTSAMLSRSVSASRSTSQQPEQFGDHGAAATSPSTESSSSSPTLNFKPLFTLPNAHDRGITCVKFSPDRSLLATASADASIKIYAVPENIEPGKPWTLLRTLHTHKAGINAIAWSPVGPTYTLASASDDKSILLWSPLSSDFPIPPSPFLGHSNYVYSLAFSPKGNILASGSYDEFLFLWDARSAKKMKDLPAHSDPVSGVDFVRDGSLVCSCASDGLIRIWDSGTQQCLKTLVHEDRKPVTAVRFSPNGKYVLAWTLDSSIRLWRYLGTDGGGCVKTYQGHINTRYSLSGTIGHYSAWDAEGGVARTEAFVVSGSEDGDLFVWDVNSKETLWKGSGHRDVVLSVDWAESKDGRGLLASVGKDRDLRVWIEDTELRNTKAEMYTATEDVRGHMVQLEIKREDSSMSQS